MSRFAIIFVTVVVLSVGQVVVGQVPFVDSLYVSSCEGCPELRVCPLENQARMGWLE